MVNGRAWTREETDELVRVVERSGNTLALAARLGRTHDGVLARAKRIGLQMPA